MAAFGERLAMEIVKSLRAGVLVRLMQCGAG